MLPWCNKADPRLLLPWLMHSSFVSDVDVYNVKSAEILSAIFRVIDPGLAGESAPFDKIQAAWLEAGSPHFVFKVESQSWCITG